MTQPPNPVPLLPPLDASRSSAAQPQPDRQGPAANLVLVVDDDPLCLEILARTLSREGFQPIAVQSGDDAVALVRSLRPAAVLLDVVMPGLDGWSVLQAPRPTPTCGRFR